MGRLVSETLCEMMRSSDDYMFVKDTAMIYHGGSDKFARLANLNDASELAGKTDFEMFPQEIAEKYRNDDRKVLETGEPILNIMERRPDVNGEQRWVKTHKRALHDANGDVIGLYGISRDISKEVMLEERAKDAEDYFRLIGRIPCGVAIVHEDRGAFYLDFANDGFLEVHHKAGDDVKKYMGIDVLKYIYQPDRQSVIDEYNRIRDNADIIGNTDYRIAGDDGMLHWINIHLRYAYDLDGISYYYASYDNLDNEKAVEERLEESIRNTDLQFFTYYPGRARCENLILNKRFSQLPKVWENYPEDFLEYVQAPEEDAKAYRNMIAAIGNNADKAECIVRFLYNDKFIWEKISMKAVRDDSGNVIRAQGHSIDVTEKIHAEERFSKERMRLKSMENGVFESFSFDLTRPSEMEIQTYDDAMLETIISKKELNEAIELYPSLAAANPKSREILLKAAARIPDQEDKKLFITTCSGRAMREGAKEGYYSQEIHYRRYVRDVIHWVSTTAEVLTDPGSGHLIAFYYTKDINNEIVRELVNSEILGKNYACVSCLDIQSGSFTVISGTDSYLPALNGMQYETALKKAAGQYVADDDVDEYLSDLDLETIRSALAKEHYYTVYNHRKQTSDRLPGHPHICMKNDIFYLDSHKDVIVFLLSDVTEIFEQERESRERLETALIAAKQASIAKSNFLSRMSHEIRTPLNAIIGMDTIAAQSMGNQEKITDCIAKIGLSARYLLSLINDILDMSRIESGKMLLKSDGFSFSEFISGVNNIIYPQIRSKGIDYECTVSGEIRDNYIGDEMKLQQILVNVLGNAVKFTEKGRISLNVSLVNKESNIENVRFVINDTGCGMAEADLEKIFDAFEQIDTSTTTVFGGTGLGLAITRNLVNLMEGSISVRSIVGIGSEFTIDVPLTVDPDIKDALKLSMDFQNLKTLIVDDDLLTCEQTQDILREIGMIGEWVTSGHEAVELVREKAGEREYYDFILIDWKMPDMNGIETTRKIRKIVGPDVTIIIISAYDWQSIEADARVAGANMMISKPLLRPALVSAFERALGKENNPESKKNQFDLTGINVLLAEDNDINAEIAKTLLENKHCTVERVSNGQKALEKFVQSPQGTFDVILMDIRMPMMDGLQTTINIRHWDRPDAETIPIIALTANAFDEDVEKSRAAGMNAHLSKPIEAEMMYSTIQHVLNQVE
ncbi:MAG: response regulator [Eubacteriaceae bacterium]|jgi:PAS domain S-box-containing protein|nr:response regulator [Eubacteriaceae bacterium]